MVRRPAAIKRIPLPPGGAIRRAVLVFFHLTDSEEASGFIQKKIKKIKKCLRVRDVGIEKGLTCVPLKCTKLAPLPLRGARRQREIAGGARGCFAPTPEPKLQPRDVHVGQGSSSTAHLPRASRHSFIEYSLPPTPPHAREALNN